jgi:hypothetical protein
MAQLTEITHTQQTRAAQEVETFRGTQNSIFQNLDSQVQSALSRSHGSWHTALMKVHTDILETQAAIGRQLDLMNIAMIDATKTYQAFDETAQSGAQSLQGRVGSGTIANLSGGIFNGA